MLKKFKRKQKTKIYVYLGTTPDISNIYWFLFNGAELMHQGKGMSASLYEFSKEYNSYALIRAENSILMSIEAPLGIKPSEYKLLLEDEFLGDLDSMSISLLDKRKTEFEGQILDFALTEKDFLLKWQEIFAQENIFFKDFYLDLSFLKNTLKKQLLVFSDIENQDLYIYEKPDGAFGWLLWNRDFGAKLPPNLQNLLDDETLKVQRLTKNVQRIQKLFEVKSKPITFNIAKPKSSLSIFSQLSFLKKLKMPTFAFVKSSVFWFFNGLLVLSLSYFVMNAKLEERTIKAQVASINSLKPDETISTEELLQQIEIGAKNYHQARKKMQKISSITTRVNSRLSENITPLEISWDSEKITFLLSVATEADLELLKGLTQKIDFFDDKAKLEFNLN